MTSKTVTREFPITMETDVLVCGGGTAGAVAAIAAARNGAKTTLLESAHALGGTATIGGVNGFHGFRRHDRSAGGVAEQVIFGMGQEILDRLGDMGGVVGKKGEYSKGSVQMFDPELMKLLLEQMCVEAGVHFLYGTYVVDTVSEARSVQGVTYVNKSGPGCIKAKVTIDCTGDADVAASAGAQYSTGRINGKPMPMTLSFLMGNLDIEEYRKQLGWKPPMSLMMKAHENGDLSYADGVNNFGYFGILNVVREGKRLTDVAWFNSDMVYNTDATNAEQMTQAWLKGRKRMYEIANFARKYLPGCKDAYILYTQPMMGIRESRNIVGDYVLTDDDFHQARRHADVVGQSGRAMNVHPPEGLLPGMVEHIGNPPFWTETKVPFDIPYRILLPVGVENLLVAGRCISATGLVMGSMRGEPQAMLTGEAAGTAAALAIRDGVAPRQVSIAKLQDRLKEQNVNLGGAK